MNTQSQVSQLDEHGMPEEAPATSADTEFIHRHIGPDENEIGAMLEALGLSSLQELVEAIVPHSILFNDMLDLPEAMKERSALAKLRQLVAQDEPGRSYIGLGYYDTWTPTVIQRNVLENPGWYTAYTPYQPEISQGRLECLLNFQQMVMDLTGMEIANASLLDEATAAAEAMALAKRVSRKKDCNRFFVDRRCFPQTIDVLRTRAPGYGFEIIVDDPSKLEGCDVFGALLQYPDAEGGVTDPADTIAALHEQDAIAVVAADIMSLLLLKPPGEMGADVVIGNTQRFGVPMGYGGPHAAYFATKETYKRSMPGRMIGVSIDSRERPAYRMALQTREQHIRREKANSNICTAQALLANVAALYAMYHGPKGLKAIATEIHRLASLLASALESRGMEIRHDAFFDTVTVSVTAGNLCGIQERALKAGVRLGLHHISRGLVSVSLDECCSEEDVAVLCEVLAGDEAGDFDASLPAPPRLPESLQRESDYLSHPIFNEYHSETEMLRYLKLLENRDLSLTHSMIPLGSCTMKLNASSEMLPISWPEFAGVHPFVPPQSVPGYQAMILELADMLAEILGFDGVSMQPNSGAQGEYAGLLTIRHYLESQGQGQRDVCLIPASAHGTNPASAQMVGMKVVIVSCDKEGNIDLEDLEEKASAHSDTLAALMLTYPSTHGVYEEQVKKVCQVIHDNGGQVYMDGANLNAMVGVARPGDMGADVSHVNLHKTFCIPHGGGGPGMGPIGVKAHLVPYLPHHKVVPMSDSEGRPGNTAVSAAPWGSAGILPISWMYITMMGRQGLKKATEVAMLNANYLARKLSPHYPVLYTGKNDMVAHECIIDLRPIKQACGIDNEDVAKRLMDYGFHAPTMSFPVAGTLMIEPTESESLKELDRFIEAMVLIREEIAEVESGAMAAEDSPLRHAPHTLEDITADEWDRSYSREKAVFPAPWLMDNKYWPAVNRVDNVYGDRNLICSCPSPEAYK